MEEPRNRGEDCSGVGVGGVEKRGVEAPTRSGTACRIPFGDPGYVLHTAKLLFKQVIYHLFFMLSYCMLALGGEASVRVAFRCTRC